MASKDEKNLAQVVEKIAKMDEPERALVQRVHEVIMAAEPSGKPRIWYGMPPTQRQPVLPRWEHSVTMTASTLLQLKRSICVRRVEKMACLCQQHGSAILPSRQ